KSLESVVQHMNSPPASLTQLCPTIDPRVAATIMRGLAREPHERWPSAEAMVAEFRAALPAASA
ncbi:MAG: serine/threonine protein kinase, partial [Planctomycetaceae bacterium]